jgi:hypothetical protein
VQDKLAAELREEDSLVLFFAGHGHTQMSKVGENNIETGFIVPVQASRKLYSDYLKIDSLLEDISKLAAKHVLVILDACYAGFALGSAMKIYRSAGRYEADLASRVSRKVITSARRDQPALDNGPVADHSLFTGTMIDGFNWATVDVDGNNFVTSSELGLYLQQRVGQSSDSQQTPDFGSFQLDDRGELVISLGRDNFDGLKAQAFSAYQQGHFNEFRQLLKEVQMQRPDSPEAIYLGYRLSLLEGRVEDALAAVQEMRTRRLVAGVIPFTERDLTTLDIQLRYWGPVLALAPAPMPVDLSVLAGKDKDHLTNLTASACADGRLYEVADESILRFCATNQSKQPVHLYYIVVTPHGRLLIGPLLETDEHRFNGLPPGIEGLGPALRIRDPGSLTETRVLFSPTRISRMLFPGTTATRPLDELDTAEVGELRMQRLWHRVVESVHGEAEDPENWFHKDHLDSSAYAAHWIDSNDSNDNARFVD